MRFNHEIFDTVKEGFSHRATVVLGDGTVVAGPKVGYRAVAEVAIPDSAPEFAGMTLCCTTDYYDAEMYVKTSVKELVNEYVNGEQVYASPKD